MLLAFTVFSFLPNRNALPSNYWQQISHIPENKPSIVNKPSMAFWDTTHKSLFSGLQPRKAIDGLFSGLHPRKQAIDCFMLFACLYRVLFSHLERSVEQVLTEDLSACTAGAGDATDTRIHPGYKLKVEYKLNPSRL